ncbi:MAG: hypothetical protein M3Z41_04170 [Candidatus Eremiobacteraeota bacterium]|nr:hypothetical protein [Candidatus Eremiobacteraeota bacterium]
MSRIAGLTAAAFLILAAVIGGQGEARAANDPYARLPAVGDRVRFDASVGGERMAWAYPSLNYLEAFLRSTIDAALSSTSYEDYQKKMGLVLGHSLTLANGAQGTVQHVQRFYYRDHQDVEVQVRVDSGQLSHSVVWTTPAELVDSSGHKYLR